MKHLEANLSLTQVAKLCLVPDRKGSAAEPGIQQLLGVEEEEAELSLIYGSRLGAPVSGPYLQLHSGKPLEATLRHEQDGQEYQRQPRRKQGVLV